MAAGRQAIMLDPLPMKRLLALEESGTEHLPPELSQEEKPLALLGRIDFGQEAKKVKSESNGSSKEEEEVVPPTWPWQGLVEHLQQADQELVVILDLITQVEANEAVTVANVVRPKLLPQETCSDLALRASSKLQHFRVRLLPCMFCDQCSIPYQSSANF
jgi:mediator of RNA polymerase II transcription subunit 17